MEKMKAVAEVRGIERLGPQLQPPRGQRGCMRLLKQSNPGFLKLQQQN